MARPGDDAPGGASTGFSGAAGPALARAGGGVVELSAAAVAPLVIIGAGRAALAVLARLPEEQQRTALVLEAAPAPQPPEGARQLPPSTAARPGALDRDPAAAALLGGSAGGAVGPEPPRPASGAFMAAWAARCERLAVDQLRSTVTQVPFEQALGLEAFAARAGRRDELRRSTAQFVPLPSASLLRDFAAAAIGRSPGLAAAAPRGGQAVAALEPLPPAEAARLRLPLGSLRVHLADGGAVTARQAVYAAGGGRPRAPAFAAAADPRGAAAGKLKYAHEVDLSSVSSMRHGTLKGAGAADRDALGTAPGGRSAGGRPGAGSLRAMEAALPRSEALRGQTILIVGGGMTAATLALGALRAGAARVVLAARRRLRRREFEADPAWFGGKALRPFLAASEPEDRLAQLRAARNGGSVNALTWRRLQAALVDGGLRILQGVEVGTSGWDGAQWNVQFRTTKGQVKVDTDDTRELRAAAAAAAAAAEQRADGGARQQARVAAGGGGDDGSDDDDGSDGDEELGGGVSAVGAGADASGVGPGDADALPAGAGGFSAAQPLIADEIWIATGRCPDVRRDPLLGPLLGGGPEADSAGAGAGAAGPAPAPTRVVGGLPVLEDGTLRWPGLALYVVGPYAGLSLGPAAGTAPGHRLAADRVAPALKAGAALAAEAAARERKQPSAADGPSAPLPPVESPWALPAGLLSSLDELFGDDEENLDDGPAPIPPPPPPPPADPMAHLKVDIRDLPASLPRVEITKYAWVDGADVAEAARGTGPGGAGPPAPVADHFVLTLTVTLAGREPVRRSGLRARFGPRSLDLWVVCEEAAHHLWLPKLYKQLLPGKCVARPGPGVGQVTLLLRKPDSRPWRFLKG